MSEQPDQTHPKSRGRTDQRSPDAAGREAGDDAAERAQQQLSEFQQQMREGGEPRGSVYPGSQGGDDHAEGGGGGRTAGNSALVELGEKLGQTGVDSADDVDSETKREAAAEARQGIQMGAYRGGRLPRRIFPNEWVEESELAKRFGELYAEQVMEGEAVEDDEEE